MIPVIESIACLISLFFAYRFPLGIPLQLLFLNMHFGHTYVGSLNLTIYFFLFPSLILTIWKRIIFFKNIDFNHELKKYSIQVALFFMMISITHLVIWKQFPQNTITLFIKSLWILPFCLLKVNKEDIGRLARLGFRLTLISTILYLPYALEYFYLSGGMSLGRDISGGMLIKNFEMGLTSLTPTVYQGNRIKNGLFALIENYSFSFNILVALFSAYLTNYFKNKIYKYLTSFWFVFIFLFTQQFLTLTLSFLLINSAVLVIFYVKNKPNLDLKLRKNLIIILTTIFCSGVITASHSSFKERFLDNFIFKSYSEISDYKYDSSTEKFGRIKRITISLSSYFKNFQFFGYGDHIDKEAMYSNHSYFFDFMISFGILFSIFYAYIFFWFDLDFKTLISGGQDFLFLALLISCTISILITSTIGLFGIQPSSLGFLIFLKTLVMRYKKSNPTLFKGPLR